MYPLTGLFVPLLRCARHCIARYAQALAPCKEAKIRRHPAPSGTFISGNRFNDRRWLV
jgi:hypothetical protein